MNNFKLEDSIEYRQIKSIYRIIENVFNSGDNGFIANASRSFQLIVSQIEREIESISKTSCLSNESTLLYSRHELISTFISQQAIDPICKEFNLKLSKNLNNISSIANYSYAKRVLWYDYEFSDDFKPYSVGTPEESTDVKMSRHSRKKAEDYFRNGHVENAFISFINTEEKHYGDFLSCYQLGLICFFEKGEHESALNYFKKAAKFSQTKLKKIYVQSTFFCALIHRLAAVNGNPDSYPPAVAESKQAYEADPENPGAIYGYAQTLACSPSYTSELQQTMSLLLDLVQTNDIFLLQMIYDRALDNLLEEIDMLYNGVYNEAQSEVKEITAKIDDFLQRLTSDSSYSVMPSKIAAIRSENREIAATAESDNSYFQILALRQRAEKLNDSLQIIIKEVSENKSFFDFKSFLEGIALKCSEELNNEVLKPFTAAQKDFDKKIKELIQMNKIYPVLDTETFLGNYKKTSLGQGDPLPSEDWRKHRIYSLVKTLSGCFMVMIFFTVLFGYALLYYGEMEMFFKIAMALNVMLWPIYGTVVGKFYYGFIESKRSGLMDEIKKLDEFIYSNEKKKQEATAETKRKYVKMIIERKNVTNSVAEQILELGMDGKFEKVKTLVS
jgi:tetratricopeptide (TPR) repeat protein